MSIEAAKDVVSQDADEQLIYDESGLPIGSVGYLKKPKPKPRQHDGF